MMTGWLFAGLVPLTWQPCGCPVVPHLWQPCGRPVQVSHRRQAAVMVSSGDAAQHTQAGPDVTQAAEEVARLLEQEQQRDRLLDALFTRPPAVDGDDSMDELTDGHLVTRDGVPAIARNKCANAQCLSFGFLGRARRLRQLLGAASPRRGGGPLAAEPAAR